MKTEKGPTPILNLFRTIWKYSSGRRHIVVLIFILFTLAVGVELMIPYVLGRIFNTIQESGSGEVLLKSVVVNLLLFILLRFGFWLLHGTGRVLERRNAFYVKMNYKQEAFDQVLELSPGWHRDNHSGDTIDKINRAADGVGRFSGLMFAPVQAITLLIGAITILAFLDLRSAGIAFLFSVFSIFFIYKLDLVLTKLYKKRYLFENFVAAGVHDFITNILTIITLRLKKLASREIYRRMLRPFRTFYREIVLNEFKWFFVSMSVTFMTAIILILYTYTEVKTSGMVLVGTLFMLYRYSDRIGSTFFNFASRYSDIVEQNAAVAALEPIKRAYEKVPLVKEHPSLPLGWKEIEIKSLNFSYEDKKHQKHHMKNVDVILKRGQRVAFIGESGSGKSTLLSLLRGLYHAKFVDVSVDSEKMDYGLKHLSDHVTLVPQEPEIFNNPRKRS